MLRKTLAATPQAKQDRGRGIARGASHSRGPPQPGRQLKQGRGPTGISGGGWSSVGQSGGLPWGPPGETSTAKPRAASTCQPEPGQAASAYRAHSMGAQQGGPEGGPKGELKEDRREDQREDQRGDWSSARTRGRTAGRQGERLQEVQTPGGRATAGPEPTIRHRDTHKTRQQTRPQTRRRRTDWRGSARPPRQLNPSRHGGRDREPDPTPRTRTETPNKEHTQPLKMQRVYEMEQQDGLELHSSG